MPVNYIMQKLMFYKIGTKIVKLKSQMKYHKLARY